MHRLIPLTVFAVVLGAGTSLVATPPDSGAAGDHNACIRKNRDVGAQLAADIAANAMCKSDSDCEALPIMVCPLGCWAAVAKQNDQKMKSLIAESIQRLDKTCRCMYRCHPRPVHVSCSKKQCVVSTSR